MLLYMDHGIKRTCKHAACNSCQLCAYGTIATLHEGCALQALAKHDRTGGAQDGANQTYSAERLRRTQGRLMYRRFCCLGAIEHQGAIELLLKALAWRPATQQELP